MASLKYLVLLAILLPTMVIAAHEAAPKPSSKLVQRLCYDKYIDNRRFCLKALSGPKAAAANNFETLGRVLLEAAAANGKGTLAVIKGMIAKPCSPAWLPALNRCARSYDNAIRSFGQVAQELREDPMTANYDVGVTRDEVVICEEELNARKVTAVRVTAGNNFLEHFISMGSVVTDILQKEKKHHGN